MINIEDLKYKIKMGQKEEKDLDNIKLSEVSIDNEKYFKISNHDFLRPFFMSIVSDSNHWMFISSNGGLTAGRKDAENALFPYYTDDKITESSEITGSKSIFLIHKGDQIFVWEPFSIRSESRFNVERNLYKGIYGNKILFEEINKTLGLTFKYEWRFSQLYGFVKNVSLTNFSNKIASISILDGIQNILPFGVNTDLQNGASNLVDAYKRSELVKPVNLGLFALSAIIVDKAEPSEALKTNSVWSIGLNPTLHLLSSLQLKSFRKGLPLKEEIDIKAEKGAYFIYKKTNLEAHDTKKWLLIAEVNQSHSDIFKRIDTIKKETDILEKIIQDTNLSTENLVHLNATADGLQLTSDNLLDARHYANSLFNIMRGGVFDNNYTIDKKDFSAYLKKLNRRVYEEKIYDVLPNTFTLTQLKSLIAQTDDHNFNRLATEYLPLKFSRRHGDPSRPWNKFSINIVNELDGSKVLDYEGNWRDIFQNWEALVHSYPAFIEGMIFKFLNATTFDGYNPYRITRDGFDWETIERDDPWSYIGYWGDHQIIYLLKFLEFIEKHYPKKLHSYFEKDCFVYANVPYKIKDYKSLLENPKDTIEFDFELDKKIRTERKRIGADGAILRDENNAIYSVNFIEKILATTLAKLSNFIPEGGIWLNTQRPEWNDANNALVGNGVSMVTLYHLKRFFKFFKKLLADTNLERIDVSSELIVYYKHIRVTFERYQHLLNGNINDADRKTILDALGEAASDYRAHVYNQGFWGKKRTITVKGLRHFIDLCLAFMSHTIDANKRPDNLYHGYNLMSVEHENEISIAHLYEMLEGQVAILSSGHLTCKASLTLLDALKSSKLFRKDQYSYILYPNKSLPGFLEKNNLPKEAVEQSALLSTLINDGNKQIIDIDINGQYHFNGNFKNAKDLENALNSLGSTQYQTLIQKDKKQVLDSFESVFNHKAFTGRSGTFYGYEGLGSIYWHMVSKLLLAVQEVCLKAINDNENKEIIGRLLEHYYEINEGIGVHKSPKLYGAFPTDPYSHTPAGKGVQQPGMTGQVKEDILSRFGELGIVIRGGLLSFYPCILRKTTFLNKSSNYKYIDLEGKNKSIKLDSGSIGFTYCQVPIIYIMSDINQINISFNNDQTKIIHGLTLDIQTSQTIFNRTGNIDKIIIQINKSILK